MMRPLLTSASLLTDAFSIRWWSEPGSLSTPMQDAIHVSEPRPGVLRIAAIDGCTPMRQTPTVAGVNGATYAAAVTAAALHEHNPVPEILATVNAHLYELGPELVAAARPSATAAVAELSVRDGWIEITAWAAGDAQVWVREHTGWRMLVGGSCCAPEVRETWAPQRDALKAEGASFAEIQQREAAFYDDATLFVNHTPLGRFAHLVLQERSVSTLEVVCATDGALIDTAALEDLETWIGVVRDVEARGVARLKTTDDLAIIQVLPRH